MATRSRETASRASITWWAAWIGAGAAIGLVFCLLWWAVVANDLRPGDPVKELVIPPGTADAIARGAPFAFVPDRIELAPGERLRVVNRDAVEHRVGGIAIPAGSTADIEATESGEFACTIHPTGHLDVAVVGRPPLAGMALLVLGIAFGTATVGWILRKSGPDSGIS